MRVIELKRQREKGEERGQVLIFVINERALDDTHGITR